MTRTLAAVLLLSLSACVLRGRKPMSSVAHEERGLQTPVQMRDMCLDAADDAYFSCRDAGRNYRESEHCIQDRSIRRDACDRKWPAR